MQNKMSGLWKLIRLLIQALKRPPLEVVRDLQELLRLTEEWLVKRRGEEGTGGEK